MWISICILAVTRVIQQRAVRRTSSSSSNKWWWITIKKSTMRSATTLTRHGAPLMTLLLSTRRCAIFVAPLVTDKIFSAALYAGRVSTPTVCPCLMMTSPNSKPTGSVLTVSSARYVPLPTRKLFYCTVMSATRLSTPFALLQSWRSSPTVAGNASSALAVWNAAPRTSSVRVKRNFKRIWRSQISNFQRTSLFVTNVGSTSTKNRSVISATKRVKCPLMTRTIIPKRDQWSCQMRKALKPRARMLWTRC